MIDIFYNISIIIPALFSVLGASIGQGKIGTNAIQAMHIQPSIADNIAKMSIIGIAITDTAAILGTVMSLMLLNNQAIMQNYYYATIAIFGIAFAMGISGLCSGLASAFPAQAACNSLARQPFMYHKILNIMLITQTLILTPNIFAFLISIIIKPQLIFCTSLTHAIQLFSSGFAMGLGSIGPSIGLSTFAFAVCSAIGTNAKSYGKILTFTFICQAIIETPLIFALLISLTILSANLTSDLVLPEIKFFTAALCIGLSTIAPGINAGKTGAQAIKEISMNIDLYPLFSKITLLSLAMIDTFAIYGLLVSMMILLYS